MITAPIVLAIFWLNGFTTMWPMFTQEQCLSIGEFAIKHKEIILVRCMEADDATKFWEELKERVLKNTQTGV